MRLKYEPSSVTTTQRFLCGKTIGEGFIFLRDGAHRTHACALYSRSHVSMGLERAHAGGGVRGVSRGGTPDPRVGLVDALPFLHGGAEERVHLEDEELAAHGRHV